MPIQKIKVTVTILADAESLEFATNAYANMSLEDVAFAIDSGEDIGIVHVEGVETIPAERIEDELFQLGNDGCFFDYLKEESS